MNPIPFMTGLYAKIIRIYPWSFREEFGEEMQVAFRESVAEAYAMGGLPLALVCLREIVHFPASLLQEVRHEFERKEMNMATNLTAPAMVHGFRWDHLLDVGIFGNHILAGAYRSCAPCH